MGFRPLEEYPQFAGFHPRASNQPFLYRVGMVLNMPRRNPESDLWMWVGVGFAAWWVFREARRSKAAAVMQAMIDAAKATPAPTAAK